MAPEASVEREAKLAVWPGFRLPDLTDVVDGSTVTETADQELEATYYDTRDLRLGRSGITLRHRTGDVDGWTLKLPNPSAGSAALSRTEVTVVGDAGSVPPELVEIVVARLRTAALEPVAKLNTLRRRVEVRDAADELVAEIVDDEVSVLDGVHVALRFREVEIELGAAGTEPILGDLIDRLRAAGAGAPDPTPKVIRALGPAAAAPPDLADRRLGRSPSAADVLAVGLTRSVRRLIEHDPVVREGIDPEGVHQARVATRRLRSDLRVYGPLVDASWARPLRDELSWLADLLGGVRDGDVLLARLERETRDLSVDDRAAAAALVDRLRAQREERRRELLDAYRSPRYVELLEQLVDAARVPKVSTAASASAHDALAVLAHRPWASFAKAARRIGPSSADEALHEVRILAKRARYAAEVASLAVGKQAQRLADVLADAQEVLGEHHDAGVAADWLRDAAIASGSPETGFVAGALAARQRVEADRLLATWPAVWDRLGKGKLTSWLKP